MDLLVQGALHFFPVENSIDCLSRHIYSSEIRSALNIATAPSTYFKHIDSQFTVIGELNAVDRNVNTSSKADRYIIVMFSVIQ